jgi:hypothetical protein
MGAVFCHRPLPSRSCLGPCGFASRASGGCRHSFRRSLGFSAASAPKLTGVLAAEGLGGQEAAQCSEKRKTRP